MPRSHPDVIEALGAAIIALSIGAVVVVLWYL
jgi:hypothetical protein